MAMEALTGVEPAEAIVDADDESLRTFGWGSAWPS